jgi:hypothetical protein
MTFRSSGYSPGDRPCYSSSTASTAPIDNRLIVLIHQHPQEKKEASATAMLRCGKHAGVGNSYSFGWGYSAAAEKFLGRKSQGDRPDLPISRIRDSLLFPG